MNAHSLLRFEAGLAEMVCMAYLNDLSDADLMRRPAPGCNHIKWQVGHLIVSEHEMISATLPGRLPALPDGFAARYSKAQASSDDAAAFDSKDVLLATYRTQRDAALAVLDSLSAEQLSAETPEQIRSYAPTVGAMFSMLGSHWMMHCGQWVVVRRQLGHAPMF